MHFLLSSAKYDCDDGYKEFGVVYPLLVFAREQNYDKAIEQVKQFLHENGWSEFEVKRVKFFDSDILESDDEVMLGAFNDALESGVSMVIYTPTHH